MITSTIDSVFFANSYLFLSHFTIFFKFSPFEFPVPWLEPPSRDLLSYLARQLVQTIWTPYRGRITLKPRSSPTTRKLLDDWKSSSIMTEWSLKWWQWIIGTLSLGGTRASLYSLMPCFPWSILPATHSPLNRRSYLFCLFNPHSCLNCRISRLINMWTIIFEVMSAFIDSYNYDPSVNQH